MKTVSLSGSSRENVGKKDAKALRNEDKVPCVVYGVSGQTHFSVKHNDMKKLVYTPDVYLIDVEVNGATTKSILQEVQQHPVTDKILHADFLEVTDDRPVKIKLPVIISGSSPGVMAGGKMQQVFRRLSVMGLAKHMPESIEVNIDSLNIGDAVRVNSLDYEGLTFLDPANAVVVSVKMARGAKKAEDEEEEAAGEEAAAE